MARTWVAYVIVAGLCLNLGGCDQAEKIRRAIDERAGESQQALSSAAKTASANAVAYDPLTVTNKVWSGNTAVRMQRGMPLPTRFEEARGVTLVSGDPMSLSEISNAISAQTGIPIRLTALAVPGKSAASPSPSSPSSPTAGASSSSGPEMPISYEGPLSGLLDRLSAFYGISWRYDGSTISITRYETRIFQIEAMPGTQEINEGMQDDQTASNGGSNNTSTSSSGTSGNTSTNTQNTLTQNSKTTIALKYWDELSAVLTSIVGAQGSAIVSPTMGTVTITTTPDIMATVSDYLAKENKRLSRQIAISVQIYSVNLTQSEDFNVAFTAFLKNLSAFSGFNYSSAAGPGITNPTLAAATAAGSSVFGNLSIAILNGANDPTVHAGDIFNALSSIGNTSEVAQFPMTTLNNHPVSRRVGTDTAYISGVNLNTTTGTATTSLFSPIISTIHDGFSLQLTPRLLDDGRILLQYSLSLIGIDSMGSTTFDGEPLSLPKTDNRIFVQQSMLRSGQTLMIGGVDQEQLQQNKQGVGTPDNFLLGGGVSSDTNHLMMFMAITPQVMDVATDEEHN
jgi:type IVB pilus formation R64 PilN family outer membrane protein